MTGWLIAFAWSSGVVAAVGIPTYVAQLFITPDDITE